MATPSDGYYVRMVYKPEVFGRYSGRSDGPFDTKEAALAYIQERDLAHRKDLLSFRLEKQHGGVTMTLEETRFDTDAAPQEEIPCSYARAAAKRVCAIPSMAFFREIFIRQSAKGISKYGVTLEQAVRERRVTLNDIAMSYAPEELADLATYLEALRPMIPKSKQSHITLAFALLTGVLKGLRDEGAQADET